MGWGRNSRGVIVEEVDQPSMVSGWVGLSRVGWGGAGMWRDVGQACGGMGRVGGQIWGGLRRRVMG